MTFHAAVVGSPIQHSLSPVLYRAAFAYLGWTDATFDAVELAKDQAVGYWSDSTAAGFAVTMPLKEAAAQFAAHRSATVEATGAANTLYRRDGRWEAENTDIAGIVAVARDTMAEPATPAAARVPDEPGAARETGGSVGTGGVWWVYGAGATARSAVAAAADAGADKVIVFARRHPDMALLRRCAGVGVGECVEIAGVADSPAADAASTLAVEHWPLDQVPFVGNEPSFVVSTIPGSAAEAVLASPSWQQVKAASVPVLDVAYNPWPSALAQSGPNVISGLEMLIHQATAQMALVLGEEIPVKVLREAVD